MQEECTHCWGRFSRQTIVQAWISGRGWFAFTFEEAEALRLQRDLSSCRQDLIVAMQCTRLYVAPKMLLRAGKQGTSGAFLPRDFP